VIVEQEYYTAKEIAVILNMNILTVYRLIKEGRLRAHRFSERRMRIHKDDLKRFKDEAVKRFEESTLAAVESGKKGLPMS